MSHLTFAVTIKIKVRWKLISPNYPIITIKEIILTSQNDQSKQIILIGFIPNFSTFNNYL